MSLSPAAPTLRSPARSSLSLTLATPDGATLKHFNSKDGPIDLGRGHKNSEDCRDLTKGRFRLEGSAVMSSKQAVLTWEDDSYAFLTDAESTNGTFIKREGEEQVRLKPGVSYRLKNNDLVTFGQPVQSSKAERTLSPSVV
ncbi:SMAD/FHA domain-containing protein [Leucosporidium creatinivorum]|uniref:SMAD/FHA domain-containing protein n=1 Tax=Leucosporidium creatinivorum TaxID=106004 RepID=A0A1Y2EW17_9BASI|nr:SMAD/FHA domain-containing protein [Leucosporidium creatinivorum]